MKHIFYPDEYYDSAYHIPYEELYKQGFRGIIYDIDNTLVPHGAAADQRSILLVQRLHQIGYDVTLLSNNKKERVEMFNKEIRAKIIWKASKPLKKNYLKAMELMNSSNKDTLFIGDQLFTDVLGAKNVGMHAILVKPMNPKEEIQIVLKRFLEKPILYFYLKKNRCKTGSHD